MEDSENTTLSEYLEKSDLLEEIGELSKSDSEFLEELSKSCPRCGKSSANSSNPQGRCSACLKKLAANKKKPGHWQRSQTKFDDAKRRENGKNGTAHKKSKGRVKSRKAFVHKFQSDEKKTGEKLSPDRIDNSRGYGKGKSGKSNSRNIKESLNVGRHHVDPKKLRNWQKRVKKSEVDDSFLYTCLLAKATLDNNEPALTLLRNLGEDGFSNYIDLFDLDGDPLNKADDFDSDEDHTHHHVATTPDKSTVHYKGTHDGYHHYEVNHPKHGKYKMTYGGGVKGKYWGPNTKPKSLYANHANHEDAHETHVQRAIGAHANKLQGKAPAAPTQSETVDANPAKPKGH